MNTKNIATVSLLVMAAGFAITLFLPDKGFFFVLRGGFEAGLVGGIADWFAVTALFRHPLGLKIPHTSLLLKNRDKLIRSLISAMENELLNKQSIGNKLKNLNLLQLSVSLATKVLQKRAARRQLLGLVIELVRSAPAERLVPLIRNGLQAYAARADLRLAADRMLTRAMEERYDEKAFDYALEEAHSWVRRPQTGMMLGKLAADKLSELNVGGFAGFAFQAFAGFMSEDKLGGILQNLLISALGDLRRSDNAQRAAILREIRVRLLMLPGDEAVMNRLREWIDRQLDGEPFASFMLDLLEEARSLLLEKLEQEQAKGGRVVFAAYRSLVRGLSSDPERVAEWDGRLLSFVTDLIDRNHYRIGQLVKDNLEQMDDASLVRMLEEKVGKDLQWIRVNGALCGFAVGVLLSLVQLL
ncbi:hypothetical protein BG53_00250 [Paenibacillus darwinianus]|uniref:DUF445 domain-containing protein n=1 Tax=Paenibacillus darwinianus TaxID=1380763 RepID=A0A9W5S1T3_9BACL|nr:DUF445 domain-containing protein [Paenibacillus darwinianus]EXX88483.1 hypothetical protein BG52_02125 [Paenibacillus darwinianus]EXX89269.1 hypothetical protein BG53_00250 [Paenibacillus darwinianus]EXX89985.1 hypothetical protein CH50_00335 [Paenibacillus darwinianus]